MRASRVAVALVVMNLAVVGCTGADSADPDTSRSSEELPTGEPTDLSTDVAFTACGGRGLACEGELDGAPYEIRLPETWNGTLLIYSHGMRRAHPLTGREPRSQSVAEPAPGVASGVEVVADALVDQGYALAGMGSRRGGWSISEQVRAVSTMRTAFVTDVGVPNRIYTWGQSVGALAALQAAQTNDWVSGSAALCGVLAGLNPNLDLALDAAVAVKALLLPRLEVTGFASLAQAQQAYAQATKAVRRAAEDPAGFVDLQVIAATAEVPTQSRTSPGLTSQDVGAAIIQNLERVLARTTVERFGVESRYGGNPSTNVGVNYGARVTADEAERIDSAAGAGATLKRVRRVAALPAVVADADARAAVNADYPRPSALSRPVVTMHTEVDPVAIVANETLFGSWSAQANGDGIRWLNINVARAPLLYPQDGIAPYGVGHCAFTGRSIVGGIQILDDWVRLGRFPTWAGNAAAFGDGSGFAGPMSLPGWPQSPTTGATSTAGPSASPSQAPSSEGPSSAP